MCLSGVTGLPLLSTHRRCNLFARPEAFAFPLFGVPAMASDFRLKEQLPQLTSRIVQTYTEVGTINHLGHCPLPNYEEVVHAIEDLKEILYPGYRRREGLHMGNVTYHVGDLIDRLHDTLTDADRPGAAPRGPRHRSARCDPRRRRDFEAMGQAKAITFLEQIPELRKILATDVQAAYDGDPACKIAGRSDLLLSRPGSDHRLPPGPRAARTRRAA